MSRLGEGFLELVHSPHIGLKILGVFRVDCFEFSFGAGGSEERSDEELGEAFEGWEEGGWGDVEAGRGGEEMLVKEKDRGE